MTVVFTARCPQGHEATWTATTYGTDQQHVRYHVDCPCEHQ